MIGSEGLESIVDRIVPTKFQSSNPWRRLGLASGASEEDLYGEEDKSMMSSTLRRNFEAPVGPTLRSKAELTDGEFAPPPDLLDDNFLKLRKPPK